MAALQTSFKWLIPPTAGLRFFIGLRLAFERNLTI
jgi:hypothetical protein